MSTRGWTSTFESTPTLTGDLVRLRPADGRDAAVLAELMADPEVGRLTGSVHRSDSQAEAQIEAEAAVSTEQLAAIYDRWARADDRLVWVILDLTTERVVGEVLLLDHDPGNSSCGFRIWISGADARGRGLGTEATRLAVAHAFETMGLHRVELEVYAFNPRARRAYEKVGFVLEGTKREALRYDDGWVDCHVMAMLSQDWGAVD